MSQMQIIDNEWDIGCHTTFRGSIYDSLKISVNKGMYSFQIFLGNPNSYKRCKPSFEDIEKSKKLLDRFPTNVFSHCPYVVNLVGSVKCLAWNGNNEQDNKTMNCLRSIEQELDIIANFSKNKSGVVIHPGSFPEREKGLKTIAKSINKINFVPNSKLLLENSAGQGTTLPIDFREIQTIIKNIDKDKRKHIGVCVDTAHIWGVGDYNLSRSSEIDRMFDEFDKMVGLDKFSLLHLNDSKVKLGDRIDLHECIGKGYIWSESTDSLVHLMNKCKINNIPSVLETHADDLIVMKNLK